MASGCLIGSSFVFKKKGLLRSQAGGTAGEGVAYLKSVRPPRVLKWSLLMLLCILCANWLAFIGVMVDRDDQCVAVVCIVCLHELIDVRSASDDFGGAM